MSTALTATPTAPSTFAPLAYPSQAMYYGPPSVFHSAFPTGRFPAGFSLGPDPWGFNLLPNGLDRLFQTAFAPPRPQGPIDWEGITGNKPDWSMAAEMDIDDGFGNPGKLIMLCTTGPNPEPKFAEMMRKLDQTEARTLDRDQYRAMTDDCTMNNAARHGLENTAALFAGWDANGKGTKKIKAFIETGDGTSTIGGGATTANTNNLSSYGYRSPLAGSTVPQLSASNSTYPTWTPAQSTVPPSSYVPSSVNYSVPGSYPDTRPPTTPVPGTGSQYPSSFVPSSAANNSQAARQTSAPWSNNGRGMTDTRSSVATLPNPSSTASARG